MNKQVINKKGILKILSTLIIITGTYNIIWNYFNYSHGSIWGDILFTISGILFLYSATKIE